MGRSKFNKTRCKQCIYHRGLGVNANIYCNYSCVEDSTCLYVGEDKQVHDRRGSDYDDCKLFIKGAIEIIKKPVY